MLNIEALSVWFKILQITSAKGTVLHCIKKEISFELWKTKYSTILPWILHLKEVLGEEAGLAWCYGTCLSNEKGWGLLLLLLHCRLPRVTSLRGEVQKLRHRRHHKGRTWASGRWLEAWRSMRGIMAVLCDLRGFLLSLVSSPPKCGRPYLGRVQWGGVHWSSEAFWYVVMCVSSGV